MTWTWGGEVGFALARHVSFSTGLMNTLCQQPGADCSTLAWNRAGKTPPFSNSSPGRIQREEYLSRTDPGRAITTITHCPQHLQGLSRDPPSRRQRHRGDRPRGSSRFQCGQTPPPRPCTGFLLQLAGSSEPSTQSLSRSHTQTRGMQRLVIAHWNWLGAQVTSAAGGRGRVRRGSGAGRGPPDTTPQSREAHGCSGHHKFLVMFGDHVRERGREQSPVVAPEDSTSRREMGQKPQDPSAV